jgi:P-type Mg2+ transporter
MAEPVAELITVLLVVVVLRSREAPWRGERPARVVVFAALAAAATGMLLPATPLAAGLRMTLPPAAYVPWLLAVTAIYGLSAQLVKKWYLRRHEVWL